MTDESVMLELASIKWYLTRHSVRAVSVSTGIPYNILLSVQRGYKDDKGLTKPYHDVLSRHIIKEYEAFAKIIGEIYGQRL